MNIRNASFLKLLNSQTKNNHFVDFPLHRTRSPVSFSSSKSVNQLSDIKFYRFHRNPICDNHYDTSFPFQPMFEQLALDFLNRQLGDVNV